MSVKIKGIYYLAIWLIILLLEFAFFVFSVKTPVVDSILNVIQRVPSELLVFFVSIKIIIPRYAVSKSYLRLILHVFLLLIVSVFIYRVCQYYAFPRFRMGKDFHPFFNFLNTGWHTILSSFNFHNTNTTSPFYFTAFKMA